MPPVESHCFKDISAKTLMSRVHCKFSIFWLQKNPTKELRNPHNLFESVPSHEKGSTFSFPQKYFWPQDKKILH